jgi:hypothetical protein
VIDRLSARPLVRRGISVATAGLLVAGSLFVPAAVHAAGNPPVAVDDIVTAVEDTQLVFPASNLASNDTDADSDPLTVTMIENQIGATITLVAGVITITPPANACGINAAHFQYDVTDAPHDGVDVGDVQVNITCVNDAPVAHDDHAPNGHQDDPLIIHADDLASNDFDQDEDVLHVTAVSNPTGGTVNLAAGEITFTPTAALCGPNTGGFDYTVSDGNGGTDTGSVTIDLMCNGTNHDPVAGNDTASGTEDTALLIPVADLLDNDTDADLGDTLHVASVSNATGGTVGLGAGVVTFTPAANKCDPTVFGFDYDVADNTDGDDFGHVTITIDCVNDAPVAVADSASVNANSGQADYNVLSNDTDPDAGDTVTLTPSVTVNPPTAGAVSVVAGKVRFTPTAVFTGQAVITYHITDGHVVTPVAGTLTIDVGVDLTAPAVAIPTAAFGSGRVNESAPIRINWSATDAGSGVAKYQVQVSVGGGAFKAVYTGTAKTITKAYPFGKTLVWRVRATDHDGNVSGWVSSATRKIAAIQETNGAIHRTGTWNRVITSGASGTGYGFTSKNHKSAGVQFTGRAVLYVAPKSAAAGWVKVYVDGHLLGRFNAHRATFAQGRIIARSSWATNGSHNILIVNDQAGKRAHLDAFIVLR